VTSSMSASDPSSPAPGLSGSGTTEHSGRSDARVRLARMMSPRGIAVAGASTAGATIGSRVLANISSLYPGALYAIHPSASEVGGCAAFRKLEDMPTDVDLVVAAVSAEHVPDLVEAAAVAGVAGAVIISSGFAEAGADGAMFQRAVKQVADQHGIRILGPNCLGFLNRRAGVAANFAPIPEAGQSKGTTAIVSQSGGVGTFSLILAAEAGLSVDWFVTTGNEVDISVTQAIDFLVDEPDIDVIAAFTEHIPDVEEFIGTARRARLARRPIVLLTGGRTEASARATFSHTGSIAGQVNLTDEICRQYGVTVVQSVEELLDATLMFQSGRRAHGPRVGIMVTSGGVGILAADACGTAGLQVPELSVSAQHRLREHMPSPFYGSTANPVDTTAQIGASAERYRAVLESLGETGDLDLVMPVLVGRTDARVQAIKDFGMTSAKPVVVVSSSKVDELHAAGIPTYPDVSRASKAMAALLELSRAVPDALDLKRDDSRAEQGRSFIANVAHRSTLLESDAKRLLRLYGVDVTREKFVRSPNEAADAASDLGYPVAAKVMSFDIQHKSDVNALQLWLASDAQVRQACDAMVTDLSALAEPVSIDGFLIQEMIRAKIELSCGFRRDPHVGRLVSVGLGGSLIEIVAEMAFLRVPFDARETVDKVSALAGGRLTSGKRGLTPEEVGRVGDVMLALQQMVVELPEIEEVDINPLAISDARAIAVDALIIVASPGG
jgi:acetate---CoA ligase (ADP-forming)